MIFLQTGSQLNVFSAWLGAIAYALQIYYDFSGYSDMALGMAQMFGFHFEENFNTPYAADGIQDFWHRWHISLSTWFKEYLYIPLGGNRRGRVRTIIKSLYCVFLYWIVGMERIGPLFFGDCFMVHCWSSKIREYQYSVSDINGFGSC